MKNFKIISPFSYHCDTFGKNFKKDDGTFLHTHNIKCLATESWDSTDIPHSCECNILLKTNILFFWISLAGSHCIDPPTPPDEHKLELWGWKSTHPPAYQLQASDIQPIANNTKATYRCKQDGIFNKLEDDFSKNTYQLTCLPDNTFSTPSWPNCKSSKAESSILFINLYFQPIIVQTLLIMKRTTLLQPNLARLQQPIQTTSIGSVRIGDT